MATEKFYIFCHEWVECNQVVVFTWIGFLQTNGGVHVGTDTIAVAVTLCEQAFSWKINGLEKTQSSSIGSV